MPKNFGCCERSSAAETDPRAESDAEGAFGWKILDSAHIAWYFFSISIRESRFSVYTAGAGESAISKH